MRYSIIEEKKPRVHIAFKMDAVRLICFFSLVFATEIQVTSGFKVPLEWKMYLSKVVEDFLRY